MIPASLQHWLVVHKVHQKTLAGRFISNDNGGSVAKDGTAMVGK